MVAESPEKIKEAEDQVEKIVGKRIPIEIDFVHIEKDMRLDETRKAKVANWMLKVALHSFYGAKGIPINL